MPQVSDITAIDQTSALGRILTEDVQVVERDQQTINQYIQADKLAVNFTEGNIPEEHARLLLFPVDDNKFCLLLTYILPSEQHPFHATIHRLQFLPEFFNAYPPDMLMANSPFRFDQTTEQQFTICTQTQQLLAQLQAAQAITPFITSLHLTETAIQLLRRALESILLPFAACQVPACRFLAYESEREKVADARTYLEQNFEQSITIKELSRKVAMNECYLKKGFKTITGKTIHEYQQVLRIKKAKEMLKEQRQSVSEVASKLGYSSISHFSTAFKKATGMKPCELLR